MAELLRNGYTMLNLACPICNNPIFKKRNQKPFCPICNREIQIVDQKSNNNRKIESLNNTKMENANEESKSKLTLNLEQLSDIINKKIIWLTKLISDETQLEALEKEVQLIQKLFEILHEIRSLVVTS